jgi:hypothetical protein
MSQAGVVRTLGAPAWPAFLSVGTASVFLKQGNGTFTRTGLTAGWQPSVVALGDVTGDGQPDLVIANLDKKQVSLYLGYGAGRSARRCPSLSSTPPSALRSGNRKIVEIALTAMYNRQNPC